MNWSCGKNGVATIGCIPILITNLIYWALLLAGSVGVIFIIIGGIRFLISGGDAKKLDQARKTIALAVLGLFLMFLSFFIINLIAGITGVGCLNASHPLSFKTC